MNKGWRNTFSSDLKGDLMKINYIDNIDRMKTTRTNAALLVKNNRF